jgi:hypothetical protein
MTTLDIDPPRRFIYPKVATFYKLDLSEQLDGLNSAPGLTQSRLR